MEQTEELISTFIEEYQGAKAEYESSRYKNSLILFSKALFALCDILIFQKFEKLPKNHSERFRILQENFSPVYGLVGQVWNDYRDSYSKSSNKESIAKIKDAIKKIAGIQGLPKKAEAIIE
jgi:hypothetical protein